MIEMKVLLPARLIPCESKVTKRSGEKTYIVKEKIPFYNGGPQYPEIKATDGVKFLVSENCINVVDAETELLWHVDVNTLGRFLQSFDLDNK